MFPDYICYPPDPLTETLILTGDNAMLYNVHQLPTRHHADQHQTYGKTDSLTARVAHMHNVTICTTLLLITLPSCQDLVFWSSSITIYFGLIFN